IDWWQTLRTRQLRITMVELERLTVTLSSNPALGVAGAVPSDTWTTPLHVLRETGLQRVAVRDGSVHTVGWTLGGVEGHIAVDSRGFTVQTRAARLALGSLVLTAPRLSARGDAVAIRLESASAAVDGGVVSV